MHSHSYHKLGFDFAAPQTVPTFTELLAEQTNVFSFLNTFSSQSRHGSTSVAGQDLSYVFQLISFVNDRE